MQTVIHRAESRGGGDYGWLKTRYSFSFAQWYDPTRMGFGALRVINDDYIAPNSGFDTHAHADMEIITIVMSGTITHTDSMGNMGTVSAGEVQVMSAGTGVTHSEVNASEKDPITLFQLWITPHVQSIEPAYDQRAFDLQTEGAVALVGGSGLSINQDAAITHVKLQNNSFTYELKDPSHGLYVLVITGDIEIAGDTLETRDAIGIGGTDQIELKGTGIVLIIEVPMV